MEKQKTVYSYHPATGEFLGPLQATLSPLDVEEFWLVPAFATEQQPPQAGEHQVAVFATGGWTLQADWRATRLWRTHDAQPAQAKIGDTPDSLQATILPPPAYAVWQGSAWGVDGAAQLAAQTAAAQQQLQQKLDIAYQSRRPLEDAVALGMATAAEQGRLADWQRYCVALSRLPQQPAWPHLAEEDWPKQPA